MAHFRPRARSKKGMACLQHTHDYSLVTETPELHASGPVQRFIDQEVNRPSKQWIVNIIEGTQEKEAVVLRNDDFVLLPDTERVNRYSPPASTRPHRRILNWLAIAQDRGLRTLRDLTGDHVPMLKEILHASTGAIERDTGIRPDQVMIYVHYPPSVYQLHIHFSYPYGQFGHRDAYRIHSLTAIINNLEIDPLYYAKATMHMAVLKQSPHFSALDGRDELFDPALPAPHKSAIHRAEPSSRSHHACGPCARSLRSLYPTGSWKSIQVQPPVSATCHQVSPLVPASV